MQGSMDGQSREEAPFVIWRRVFSYGETGPVCVEQAKGGIEAFTQNKMFMIAQQSLVENKEQSQNAIQDNVPFVCITAQNQED